MDMGILNAGYTDQGKYHVPSWVTERGRVSASVDDMERIEVWANDPNCYEKKECAQMFSNYLAKIADQMRLRAEERKQELQNKPFYPGTDARHIVTHLGIVVIVVPVVIGLFYGILTH